MRALLRFFVLLAVALAARGADPLLADARRAQALLGPGVWSRVLRLENESRVSVYPRVLHALVFEFAGVLWFYTGRDGTQSLSLHLGRLDEDKADLGPLLREIDPGFRRFRETGGEDGRDAVAPGRPRNACFIESLVALRERLARGLETIRPALLAYYADLPSGPRGHTVLTFESDGRAAVIDPERRGEVRWFAAPQREEPLALARQLGGLRVGRARLFPLTVPSSWLRVFAAGDLAEPVGAGRRSLSVR
ncbi:MAG: hypothetical protein HZA93_09415 [Verrucomicrobia bacterium]|nr:hypothetical protein [Verrucomicrobiota bacterium]